MRAAKTPLVAVDVIVEAGDWPSEAELTALATRVTAAALRRIDDPSVRGGEIAIVFTNDARVRELNRRFRHLDKPTNVLSFPSAPAALRQDNAVMGDVVLARETVVREAESQGLTTEAHVTHLILHGFLHVLGYDHGDDAQAIAMERLETAILDDLGIADAYLSDQREA